MTALASPPIAGPFRGLSPFGESELDSLLFFGRERETEIVTANLLASRLTVLYGPSGVGKSSLLRAGVARRIREVAERRATGHGPDAAVVVFSSWSTDPVGSLRRAIGAEMQTLVGQPIAPPAEDASLADTVEHWTAALAGDLFLVLDQFEEYFVYHAADREPGTLAAELPALVVRPGLRAHVLLSLRDDALARLDPLKERIPGLYTNVVRLDRLDHAAATAAILGPVRRFNELNSPEEYIVVEPELVAAVLAQAAVADEPGRVEPPYLQLVMERLWDEEIRLGSSVLRASTLSELGGAQEIVRDHLDRALSGLVAGEQETAARMFEHLVTPSGTKVAHRASDLAHFARIPEREADATLSALGQERIVRAIDEAADGAVRYEIFHDVLAGAILGWQQRREVEVAHAATRRRQRRLVATVVVALGAVLIMGAITAYALTQRSTARSQERAAHARALAASALTQLDSDPELSLMLALQAARLSNAPLIETVLRSALLDSRVRRVVRLGAPVTAAVFQRDTHLASGLTTSRIFVADGNSGEVLSATRIDMPHGLLDPTGRHALGFGPQQAPSLYAVTSGVRVRLNTGPISAAVFSPDGAVVATANGSDVLRVWDSATGRLVRTIALSEPVSVVAFSPDHTLVAAAAGRQARNVTVFDLAANRKLKPLPEPSAVTQLAFSPGGRLIAVAGTDRTVRVQDVRTRALVASDSGQVGHITGIAFSPRATLLATSSTDGTVRVWRVGGELVTVLFGHRLYVTSVAFSSDGSRIVTTSNDGTARVWNAVSGQPIAVLAGHGATVNAASFSRDGRSIVTAGQDGTLRFWYAVAEPTLELRRREHRPVAAARAAQNKIVVALCAGRTLQSCDARDVSVSADGSRFATGTRNHVVVRRSATGAVVASFVAPAPVTGVALAPDGQTVAAGGPAGTATIFSLTGGPSRSLHAGRAALTRLAFSPDGQLLAAGSEDHTAKVWNVSTGSLRVLSGHSDTVWSARFSPDGQELVTASRDHDARIWRVATGETVHILRAAFGQVSDAAFSSDGRWVVTAGPGNAGLWDARSGSLLFFLQGHLGPLTSASFAPDGYTVITSGIDGTVRAYRCDVCGDIRSLRHLADSRLAATHRQLTDAERRAYLP